MKLKSLLALVVAVLAILTTNAWGVAQTIPNRLIDYEEFSRIVRASEPERESRRLSETQFLQAMREKGTVTLDARSATRFAERHITGAVNLPFTDFTAESLARVIPTKKTKVLIYCNNNFLGDLQAFATKAPAASLNLSTYTSLKAYGYTNIYELGPLLDVKNTVLPFSGSLVKKSA